MSQVILITLNLIMSFNFTQMNHPLAMGLILLIQTILISLISGLMTQTFWFSYILFLIMLGGMLVLFIYMTSLASNELFSFSMKTLIINLIIFMFMLMLLLFDNSLWFINNNSMDMNSLNNIIMLQENKMELMKLYNFPTMNLTLLMVNYLFLTLIIIVKITNLFHGPLRQSN
uniref:NADH-ubiquinone oxidoreductase chain 6 n=1 Tax=Dysmicohermes ingens TaxID=1518963 RepID=A0A0U1WNR0_9NEOP|nr:NADH dehydrogenase subunit 6 [Dysmicohermes ingens]AIG24340.1 NADH dehydrogenase subunit 6 [Dysmicohermes ingens]